MARANRHYIPGYVWHITHRCHKKEFLLKFARDNRIHAKDCEDCETKEGMLDEIRSEIHLEGDLDDAQRKRLVQIATRCPVHRTLSSEIKIRTAEF